MIRKIGIVTGTRADFGLLSRTIKLMQDDNRFDTRVFACGSHLSPEFGMTINELKDRNVQNLISVEMLLSTSSRVGLTKSVGLATISFADAFERERLDCLLVLGDRYEILSATQAAMFLDIPVAHIHGGEVTEGAFDDAIRHSITKMANVHFPATEEFSNRIKQLGEQDHSIFVVGSPGIDNIIHEPRVSKIELMESLGITFNRPLALVTYHPVTKTKNSNENNIAQLVNAIREKNEFDFIITFPNADGGGKGIIEQWETIAHLNNVFLVPSLGFVRYLSIMEHVECVIGNSSSGIIEAPSFNVGTINIGTRQHGRPKASTVLDVSMDKTEIVHAIDICCSDKFKDECRCSTNPYGGGNAANLIVEILATIDLDEFKIKTFVDRNINEK